MTLRHTHVLVSHHLVPPLTPSHHLCISQASHSPFISHVRFLLPITSSFLQHPHLPPSHLPTYTFPSPVHLSSILISHITCHLPLPITCLPFQHPHHPPSHLSLPRYPPQVTTASGSLPQSPGAAQLDPLSHTPAKSSPPAPLAPPSGYLSSAGPTSTSGCSRMSSSPWKRICKCGGGEEKVDEWMGLSGHG